MTRTPIVTISGFLGAGKTTLVNQLLAQKYVQRTVVFVNDFGEVNIDHSLITAVEEDKISLKNGCICCTLNDDLIAQVMQYVTGGDRPDCFVIEASGIADPTVLAHSINTLEQSGAVIADMRIYVIDAENFHLLPYDDCESIVDHAAASDLIVINKTDRAAPVTVRNLNATLAVGAPYTLTIETKYCDIGAPLDSLFPNGPHTRMPNADSPGETSNSEETAVFSQWSIVCDDTLDRRKFELYVRSLPQLCWRAKGVLTFGDDPESRYVFHLVGQRASLERLRTSPIPKQSQFVAIGKSTTFQPKAVEAAFLETLVPSTQ